MEVTKASLQRAVSSGIIFQHQAESLYHFLQADISQTPKFSFTHILYYLGGLIAIGAMTLFMTLGWEEFGGAGIVLIACIYAIVGIMLANRMANKNLPIPAGICATFVICITPIATYGIQQWLGVWPEEEVVYKQYHLYVKWHWLYIELATLAVGIVLAWFYRYPFMVMPIAVTLWYLTMDLTSVLEPNGYTWELRSLVIMYLGLLMTLLAFWTDIRSRTSADYAFWLYLFGVIAFWGGLSCQDSDSEWSKFMYFTINMVMIGVGALLVRRVFVIFGGIGCCIYLGHLASNVFKDSWLFPIALTAIGLLVVYLGILWQKHESVITRKARSIMPTALRELLDAKQ